MTLTETNYCQTHDLFDCWFAHEVTVVAEAPEAPEDLDAPTVTMADLAAARLAMRGESYVEGDNGSHYNVVGIAGDRTFYVRSRFGLLARVVVTSRHSWLPEQRVKITFGRDHGRADGAVTFDGVSVGGKGWLSALESIGVRVSV
jgi:hypothetical protein